MADYTSLAIPIRNFNKVWNGQTSSYYDGATIKKLNDKYFGNRTKFSVKDAIEEKWGENATTLITNAITDLQSPRSGGSNKFASNLLSAQINATFTGNISIVLKQAASYPTASAVLSSSSLAKGSKGFAYLTGTTKLQELFDEIDKHTGAHYKRRKGMQTEELASINRSARGITGKWVNSKFGALHPAKWIQAMDVQTTAALWIASKYEIEKKSKYKKGSEEYWKAVTDLYNRVIEETQPEYDVLHRAEIQKEKNVWSKTVSLFQTQPLQNTGVLYDAYRGVMWAQQKYNANKTEANKTALNEAKKNALKASWAIASASITFATFSYIALMILHKPKKYKDEDGKVTVKSSLVGIAKESGQTLVTGFVPIAADYVFDLLSRILSYIKNGKLSDYDYIENMGISAINNLASATASVGAALYDVIKGDKEPSYMKKSIYELSKQIGQMFGLPVNNVENFVNSGISYYHELIKKDYEMWQYNAQQPTSKELIAKYVEATNNGDKDNAQKNLDKWLELNEDKDRSDFESRLTSYLAGNDSDIVRAVQYRYDYNTIKYESILNKKNKKADTRKML